jgi:hypothetical protein
MAFGGRIYVFRGRVITSTSKNSHYVLSFEVSYNISELKSRKKICSQERFETTLTLCFVVQLYGPI